MTRHALRVEHVSLRAGAFALEDVSFEVAAGSIFVILGPSGAGKTLLLETIAGFYRPDRGSVWIDGRDVTKAPPEARRVAFMLQDYGLFPHLTVAQNVAFARRYAPVRDNAEPVDALLARFGVQHLANRRPGRLSGGEKQRVALARSIAAAPQVFLFDEPLAALDARNRAVLRPELKAFLRRSGVPAVYVTHDQSEALALADAMAVMRNGRMVQAGTPSQILNAPADADVARFVGVETVLDGKVVEVADGDVHVAVPGQVLHVVSMTTPSPGASVFACIRPEDVAIARMRQEGTSVRNSFVAKVLATEAVGPLFRIALDCGFPLVAYVSKQSYLQLRLFETSEVVASVKATAIHLIER